MNYIGSKYSLIDYNNYTKIILKSDFFNNGL